jgi:hypothetical protein
LFYDSGGPEGDYLNSQNLTLTVYPETAGSNVKVSFMEFNVENNYDFLKIYNGVNATAPLLANLTGTNLPETFTATNPEGALTFVFTSDGTVVRPGWKAHLTCEYAAQEVTFVITDNQQQPLEGVVITIAQTEITTNSQGEATIELQGNNNYSWTALKTGYYEASGEFELLEEPITVEVELSPIPTFNVAFTVTDQDENALEGVSIDVNSQVITTSAGGLAEIDLIPGNYNWSASLQGYHTQQGNIVVVDEDLEVSVSLSMILYNISFTIVSHEQTPVSGAEINIDGYGSLMTNEDGEATFTEVAPGNGMAYSVAHDDYFTHSGTLDVVDDHVQMHIELDIDNTSVQDLTEEMRLVVFPNPTSGQINVRFNSMGQSTVVTLTNYQGQTIRQESYSPETSDTTIQYNLRGLSAGIYYLKVVAGNHTRIQKIILN